MRVLVDICHPAHVHFFRNITGLLQDRGHDILITSRQKEIALDLLDELKLEHRVLSAEGGGLLGLGQELLVRNRALMRIVREFRPAVMAAVGGIFVAQVGAVTRVPTVVFYDTENARLQNLLTYPFAGRVVAPRCYRAWLPRRNIRYDGYHELAYLHPSLFTPDRQVALANGLAPEGETYFLRVVAWQANHDVGERGWSPSLLADVVSYLADYGRVLISAEGPLPEMLEAYRYRGSPKAVHDVMAHCRLFIGESATMASESAVLGVPAIYAAHTGRGYTDEQEARYGLVRNVRRLEERAALAQAIDAILSEPFSVWAERRRRLLDDTIEVAPFAARCIEDHASSREREAC